MRGESPRLALGWLLATLLGGTAGAQAVAGDGMPPRPDEAAQPFYPVAVADRPLLLPPTLYEATVELGSVGLDCQDCSFGDVITSSLDLRAGFKNEASLGLDYALTTPDGSSGSRLTQARFAMRLRLGQQGAVGFDLQSNFPTEDFRSLATGMFFGMRRKVIPRLAIEGSLGARYFIIPKDAEYQSVSVVGSIQGDYQVLPNVATSARLALTVPVYEDPDLGTSTAFDLFLRGTYSLQAMMVDFYAELGVLGGEPGGTQFLVGAAVRFP